MNQEVSFGQIVKEHRRARDLTQAELARRVACATITIRKIEADALRPSQQIAERLAMALGIPLEERAVFVRLARTTSLRTPSPPPLPTPTVTPAEIGEKDLTGRAIRGYELGERIGSGGFGVVYRAIQPFIDREVAIKIILPHFANLPDFIRRFEAEAQLVARLEHPHIVPLYDYWREPEVAYLVMRFLRGGDLQSRLKVGPLAVETVDHLLEQIGTALHAAHRAGVIHRDLKPANILLDEDGNGYLTDFGIAKNLNLEDQTRAGEVLGSPAYFSPEQIKAEPVKVQADIYCLGIMLFELLTGQKPFQGPTPIAYVQQHLDLPLPSLAAQGVDLPITLDPVIQRATAKDPVARYPDVLSFIEDFHLALGDGRPAAPYILSDQPSAADGQQDLDNPYKGLRAFSEADAADFFGRSTFIQALLTRLAEENDLARFLAVVGPSGSGKSSVARAGLIPALRQGGLPGSDDWFIVEMLPGSHPLEELEAALLRVAINPPESLLAQLREDERGLLRAVRRILPADGRTELVLVIDQFEELFTLCTDEAVRLHFMDSLVTAILEPRSRLRVIITLRADFTDRPLQYVDFGELVRQRTEFVLPLTPDELEEVIRKPAERVGLTVEPGLPETIIQDLGDQPGTLPLLQYTLTELFERRVGRVLTLGAYQASGGVRGALTSHADALYAELDEAGQQAARQLFLRLITLGEITGDGLPAPDTRRRVLRSELASLTTDPFDTLRAGGRPQIADSDDGKKPAVGGPQSAVINTVIDQFGRHRLLTFDRDPVTRGPTVEVAHEALIREWGRLRGWLDEDREFLLWQQRLRAAHHQWTASEQDEGALLRGAPLAEAENWFNQRQDDLSENERNFIQASLDLRERRAAERESQRQRELEAAQKLAETEKARAEENAQAAGQLKQRAVFLTGALIFAGILAVVAMIFGQQASESEQEALAQQQEAEHQAEIAFSRELAAAAVNNLDVDPERSILLALEGLSAAHTLEAETALHTVLPASRVQLTLPDHPEGANGVAFSSDGTRLVTGSNDGTIKIWDTLSGQELLSFAGHNAGIWDVEFSPDGTRFATSGLAGTAKVWDAAALLDAVSGETANVEALLTLVDHTDTIFDLAFSPDGSQLATASVDGTAKVWDTETGELLLTLNHSNAPVWAVTFNPEESQLVTGSRVQDSGIATVWDLTTGRSLFSQRVHDNGVTEIIFSSDGKYMVTSSADAKAKVWDMDTFMTDTAAQPLLTLAGHKAVVLNVRFSPDEQYLATAGIDGKAKLWLLERKSDGSLVAQEWLTLLGHIGHIIGLEFNPEGTRLATGSRDGTVRIWDLSPSRELLTLADHKDWVYGVAFSPDGALLATTSRDGTAKVWDFKASVAATAGQELFSLSSVEMGQVNNAAFSPDGMRLATANGDGTATIWDTATGRELVTLSGHAPGNQVGLDIPGVTGVAFSPDGKQLITGSDDGTAKIWDTVTGQELLTLVGHTGNIGFPFEGVLGVAFSPDGKHVATVGSDDMARVWDSTTGEELLVLPGESGMVIDVAFSPDGSRLATAGFFGNAKVWDISAALETGTATAQELLTLSAFASGVMAIAFSPDGAHLATGTDEGIAEIWDVTTGEELLALFGHTRQMMDLAFSPDGNRLVTASRDGTARVYVLPVEELVDLAKSRLTRPLSTEECQQFLHMDECPGGL